MDQPGPSSRNVVPQMFQESPESPSEPENIENDNNIPRVGIETPLGIVLESEEPSSEEENNASPQNSENEASSSEKGNNAGPQDPDYGQDDDYIGDNHFTLYTRRDVYSLQGWRAFVRERWNCAGFLVPDPPISKRLNLILRALYGENWQRAVLSGSGEVTVFQLPSAITGYSNTSPRERRKFLRLFGVWANSEFRAGLRDLACRGGFLDLD